MYIETQKVPVLNIKVRGKFVTLRSLSHYAHCHITFIVTLRSLFEHEHFGRVRDELER